MGGLRDADVVEWSGQQAQLLRRHAAETRAFAAEAGEPVNPRTSQGGFAEPPDWANIIGETGSVGRSEVSAVESWWFQAFLHGLKAEAWPLSRDDLPHRRGEARGFRAQARRKCRPSMSGEPLGSTQSKTDLPGLYADALSALPETTDDAKSEGFARGQPPFPVPPACPVTLDELLG